MISSTAFAAISFVSGFGSAFMLALVAFVIDISSTLSCLHYRRNFPRQFSATLNVVPLGRIHVEPGLAIEAFHDFIPCPVETIILTFLFCGSTGLRDGHGY